MVRRPSDNEDSVNTFKFLINKRYLRLLNIINCPPYSLFLTQPCPMFFLITIILDTPRSVSMPCLYPCPCPCHVQTDTPPKMKYPRFLDMVSNPLLWTCGGCRLLTFIQKSSIVESSLVSGKRERERERE